MQRPCSDRGLFVSVDGPSGAGKTTIVRHLAQRLLTHGRQVHVTAEPSAGQIGRLARDLTETVTGHALACLYTADRYHHLQAEIRPQVAAGNIVISDRYAASGLVTQRFDAVEPEFLWTLNESVDIPDLAVILEADPDLIAERLRARGPHNRFQTTPGSSRTEVDYYRHAYDRLARAGFDIVTVDCSRRAPEQIADALARRILTLADGRRPTKRKVPSMTASETHQPH